LIVAPSILAEPDRAASKSEGGAVGAQKPADICEAVGIFAALPCNSLSRYICGARVNRAMLAGLFG
jgi:hypothetical protein